jgi:predicted transglutaminase-like cysteine proteinase
MTVVWSGHDDGHAVLTVHTEQVDLVLDNQEPEVRRWVDTGYEFVKRSSQADANRWVYVDGVPASQPALVASISDPPLQAAPK